jgi:crotonobetainyl-CoA:carnitine CoA-transferase CaiB-like acyl-CoA transferase
MLESVLSFLWASDMGAFTFADQPVPIEQGGSFIDLIYQTADGYMTIATNSDAEWQALCRALNHPEWIADERFTTAIGRSEFINERLELVQSALHAKTTEQWLALMTEFDVPAAPTLTRAQVIEHRQVQATGIIVESQHPDAGRLRQARVPARFSDTVPEPPRGAPRLGQHNDEVLAELGYSPAEVAELAERGVIGTEQQQPAAAS